MKTIYSLPGGRTGATLHALVILTLLGIPYHHD